MLKFVNKEKKLVKSISEIKGEKYYNYDVEERLFV